METSRSFRGWYAATVLVLTLFGVVPARADLLGQDFAGAVTTSVPTDVGLSYPVSGSVIYLPAVQLPAVQLPAVQDLTLTLGPVTYHYSVVPPRPCSSSYPPSPCVDITLQNGTSGSLTGISGQVLSTTAGLGDLFLTGTGFYIASTDPGGDCPSSAVLCGTLDFSNSSPYAVPEPPVPALLTAGLAALILAGRRRYRKHVRSRGGAAGG